MRKIGLLSDTHGYLDPRILKHFEHVDEIWHAGDIGSLELVDELRQFKPLRIVYGNIDGGEIRREVPARILFEIDGLKIAMTHIAGRPGKYVREVDDWVRSERPDVFICGHSHILLVQKDQKYGHMHMNPGACGNKGFHTLCTGLRFGIKEGKLVDLEVIEMKRLALVK